jgi:hypothetical protein
VVLTDRVVPVSIVISQGSKRMVPGKRSTNTTQEPAAVLFYLHYFFLFLLIRIFSLYLCRAQRAASAVAE